jgi:putative endonuclease
MIYGGFVYILTTQKNTALYVGVTSDLYWRIFDHKKGTNRRCFTSRYNVKKLVYFKVFPRIEDAIAEEKRIKAGSRAQKIRLIESMNPEWKDLWEEKAGKEGRRF